MEFIVEHKKRRYIIERKLWVKRYTLIVNKERCRVCNLCRTVCPKEAIEISKSNQEGGSKQTLAIKIDPKKCVFCGICVSICPFSALKLLINNKEAIPVVETESFPTLIKDIEVDTTKCNPHCTKCMDSCPLKININLLKRGAIELCPCCGWCQETCPDGLIKARKIFYGTTKIHFEKCPEGCRECVDFCPVNAISLDNAGKAYVNNKVCIYCGACLNVCPVDGAIEINRTGIRVTQVRSGAWNRAFEKLTSTKTLAKELRRKSSLNAYQQVRNRF